MLEVVRYLLSSLTFDLGENGAFISSCGNHVFLEDKPEVLFGISDTNLGPERKFVNEPFWKTFNSFTLPMKALLSTPMELADEAKRCACIGRWTSVCERIAFHLSCRWTSVCERIAFHLISRRTSVCERIAFHLRGCRSGGRCISVGCWAFKVVLDYLRPSLMSHVNALNSFAFARGFELFAECAAWFVSGWDRCPIRLLPLSWLFLRRRDYAAAVRSLCDDLRMITPLNVLCFQEFHSLFA